MPTPCELDLVRAAAAPCPEATSALYGANFGPLQRRALAITGCPQDAADAAQDALLATFERLGSSDGTAVQALLSPTVVA